MSATVFIKITINAFASKRNRIYMAQKGMNSQTRCDRACEHEIHAKTDKSLYLSDHSLDT